MNQGAFNQVELLLDIDYDEESSCCSSDSDDWTMFSDESSCFSVDDDNCSLTSEEDRRGHKFHFTPSSPTRVIAKMGTLAKTRPEVTDKPTDTYSDLSKSCHVKTSMSNILQEDEQSVMSVNAIAKLRSHLGANGRRNPLISSASTGELSNMVPRRVVNISQTRSAQDEDSFLPEDGGQVVRPDNYFVSLMKSEGIDAATQPASSLEHFFFELTNEHVSAYESDLVNAIRSNDVVTVMRIHQMGGKLLCCNKFGESAVHMICRKGYLDLLRYFMEENVPVRLKDDSGRTPLHDMCWSSEPNFECVKLLLESCPDMLLISDSRGFTPLAYVPRLQWGKWCSFLGENKHILIPRELGKEVC